MGSRAKLAWNMCRIQVGEYVVVHVGFAISKVDEEEAQRTYHLLQEMDQLTELMAPVVESYGSRGEES